MAELPRLKVNPPLGQLPVLQYCALDQLKVDESYQRSLETKSSQALIRRIAINWDWSLCQPLIVARRADNGLYVVDGQHRLAAARMRGDIWQLPCVVASYRDAAEEAASFVALNQERRPLNRLQLFRAAVAAGAAEAIKINRALEGAGMWITGNQDLTVQKPGAMTCVGGLEACLRSFGEQVLATALAVLGKSFPDQPLRYAGSLFPGIAMIVAGEMHNNPGFAPGSARFAAMIDFIGRTDQAAWYKRTLDAAAADPNLRRSRAAAQVFRAAWADRLRGLPSTPPPARPPQATAPAATPPVAARPIATAPKASRPAPVGPPVWCDQCDQKVSQGQAAACASPFCKAKAAAA